jgi:hypothetical protein
MSVPQIFNTSAIVIQGLSDDVFSTDGKSITDPVKLISQIGLGDQWNHLKSYIPHIINRGNQGAVTGVIQDPAGSAVGSGAFPLGAGGSGAIYTKFTDLKPIPQMAFTEAVFNSSTGPGFRVLHSYSPDLSDFTLQLKVTKLIDREKAIELISRTYANAMFATIDAANTKSGLLENVSKINFTAVSGNIYAGSFKTDDINHLHPSYHLLAIMIASAEILKNNLTPLTGDFYLYDKVVYDVAVACSLAWAKLSTT